MSTIPITGAVDRPWVLPSRGRVGMSALIIAESAIFTIFVVAYIYNIGRSISGPTPQQVLEVPIFATVCLLSSSLTVWIAERALHHNNLKMFGLWWFITWALGIIFLAETGIEWRKLIYHDGLTIHTNLFGTTYYSLVGLHASHVTVGLIGILTVLIFTFSGKVAVRHAERIGIFALYWHFVDAVWVVVFTVVYIVGR
jgi:cytochrome c oxidase subunit III